MATGTEYRYVGTYANTLSNGRPVEPGEFVYLDKDEVDENKGMIDDELLVATADQEEINATDAAKDAAKKAGIPLAAVRGTGVRGTGSGKQITVDDVDKYVSAQEAEQGKED